MCDFGSMRIDSVEEPHTHPYPHLLVAINGKAKVVLGDREVIVHENESLLVDGKVPHSVWNNSRDVTVMLGITVIESKSDGFMAISHFVIRGKCLRGEMRNG